ncbi:MAG: type II toxin-antitoxin system Phd/YefM family antitoxin [Deltaproteobacteria bacterium]|nr:type II toxin-antitoxin system Phd/YefM family antitoxin [Deltaproteobacteria bacterium]
MKVTNIYKAKTEFSKLIERTQKGEEIIISKAGKPLAKIIPFKQRNVPRNPGYWKNKIKIADDFDKLPHSFMKHFKTKK